MTVMRAMRRTFLAAGLGLLFAARADAQLGAILARGKAAVLEGDASDRYRAARTTANYLDAARRYSRVADEWGKARDGPMQSSALYFKGRAYFLAGRTDSALVAYQRGLAGIASLETGGRDRGGRAYPTDTLVRALRREIGAVYQALGRPDSALALFRAGAGSCVDAKHLDPNFAYDREIDDARRNARRGDEVPDYPRFYCQPARLFLLTAIASSFVDLGVPDSALAYFRHAEAESHGDGRGGVLGAVDRRMRDAAADLFFTSPRFPYEAVVRTGMAEAFVRLRQPDSALRQYRRVLAIQKPGSKVMQTSDWRGLARALIGIGDLMVSSGRADSALWYLEKGLETTRATNDVTLEAIALHRLARFYAAATGAERSRSLAYFDSASVAKAASRARAPGDENRLGVVERNLAIEPEWAMSLLEAGAAGVSIERARAALAAAERGRARALLDFLGDSTIARLPRAGTDMAAAGDSLVRGAVRGGKAALVYLHVGDTLVTWLIDAASRVQIARAHVTLDSVASLVRVFREGIGADAAARGVAREDSTERGAAGFTGLRSGPDPGSAARALSRVALPAELAAAIATANELLIVPAGPLHAVAFAALPLPGDSVLLGERIPIRLAPSITVAIELAARNDGSSAAQAVRTPLVVGNPTMPASSSGATTGTLPPLPGAEAEARWLAGRVRATPLLAASATWRAVRERMATSTLLHFATHGYAYSARDRVRASFVALAPSGDHSGLLTVGELLDSDVMTNAALVVLSACQTGLGDIRQSEGVVGLQRAFLAKGARGVLASLWNVSDDATRLLMERFYAHWLDDPDRPNAAVALHRATADVRRTPGMEHPRFWASFQLVGGP
jgi:tetratricopeptide (TPR) repeat protein